MRRKTKIVISTIIFIIAITIGSLFLIDYVNDESKLTVDENKWINNNLSTVLNVNIFNNIKVFGDNGYGILYDFVNDFSKQYNIKINPITYNTEEKEVTDGFKITTSIDKNSVVFYEDHYILISKNQEHIKNIDDLNNKKIGIVESDFNHIKNYITNIEFNKYTNKEKLIEAFENATDINYIIVPRELYTNFVVENDYSIIYHFGDIKSYMIYEMKENDPFSTILNKYFIKWKKNELNKSISKHMLKAFVDSLNLTEKDIKELTSKVYNYGFINNSPYEVLLGGNYGGIVSEYLEGFSNFTGVEFKFTKYRNYKMFVDAVNKGNVDIYFNYYKLNNNFTNINTNMDVNYYIIANENNKMIINSLNSLKYKTVYVLEDSLLSQTLSDVGNINIKNYQNIKELKKSPKDSLVMIDKETYEYMANKELKDYNVRYQGVTNSSYTFKTNVDKTFTEIFTKYIMIQNNQQIRVNGLSNYNKTLKKGSILGTIAKYLLYIIIAIILLIYLLYRKSKKIIITKKIKKEDKMKFIDQLTSLKNRNYLNENIDGWNKNTIYPQTTIVIDLDKVQDINDTHGYEEGDRQIQAAANILIRTQLDNSDIIRTDGNEFLIYLVGYDERHITSYIRKLNKEFKNLPYNFGAQIGFSVIKDDLKTIEDAINESVEDVKNKKQEL